MAASENWFLQKIIDAATVVAPHSDLVKRNLSRFLINRACNSTMPRPLPYSLFSAVPKPEGGEGPVNEYVSWPGLKDTSFSSRHLPPAPESYIASLPNDDPVDMRAGKFGPVTELFRREAGDMGTDRSTVLFSHFAQWFTDSFLRTDQSDRRKNTSNHEIDLCQIYGLTEASAHMLRTGQDGQLKSQLINGEEYPDYLYEKTAGHFTVKPEYQELPYIKEGQLERLLARQGIGPDDEKRGKLYATGLERGNITPGYVAMSTVFLREHNRIATGMKEQNPTWDDERLFQTARMVNTACLLKIVAEDYIGHIAGRKVFVLDNSYAEEQKWYRTNHMSVEFSLLYRWHGLVPDTLDIQAQKIPPQQFLTNNSLLEQFGVGGIIQGSTEQKAGTISLANTPDFLMPVEWQSIKMGRDFRLQPYNAYREAFGMKKFTGWTDLTDNQATQGKLESLYGNIDRMELYVGLFAESPDTTRLSGSLMTRMVACDAFSQALTNPILSKNVFTPQHLTDFGLEQVAKTTSIDALVQRTVKLPEGFTAHFTHKNTQKTGQIR